MRVRHLGRLVMRTVKRFDERDAMRQGAALAFYATLSLAPLVLLVVSALAMLPRGGDVERVLFDQLPLYLGDASTGIVESILEQSALDEAAARDAGQRGVIGSLALLVFGGSLLFVNVQGVLNGIWSVRPPERGLVEGFVRDRMKAIAMMGAAGLILVLSTALDIAAGWVAPRLPVSGAVVNLLELAVSGVVLAVLCAAAYRILPAVEIAWRDVMLGAVLTTVLFLVGRTAIGSYLSQAATASRFGAAGSVVVFLMWVYYSAQIFLFGAVFTQVQAEEANRPILPSRGARRVESRVV